ncbi:hypothetical protein C8R43DRAFT_1198982 [Mycena crocata]|nr:hypothetical protein C8R43DRAFT_1198982 [Mycena crocata]
MAEPVLKDIAWSSGEVGEYLGPGISVPLLNRCRWGCPVLYTCSGPFNLSVQSHKPSSTDRYLRDARGCKPLEQTWIFDQIWEICVGGSSISWFKPPEVAVVLKRVVVYRFLAQLRNFPASFDHFSQLICQFEVLQNVPSMHQHLKAASEKQNSGGLPLSRNIPAQVKWSDTFAETRIIPGEAEPARSCKSSRAFTLVSLEKRTPEAVQGQCMMTKQHYQAQDWAGDGDDGQDDNGGTKHCMSFWTFFIPMIPNSKQLLGASPVYPRHSMVFSGDGRPVVAKFGAFGFYR